MHLHHFMILQILSRILSVFFVLFESCSSNFFFIFVCHLYCICLSLWSLLVYSCGHGTTYFAVQQLWVLQGSLKFLVGEIYLWTKLSLNSLPAAFKNFTCCLETKKGKPGPGTASSKARSCFLPSEFAGCPWNTGSRQHGPVCLPLCPGRKWSSAITVVLHSWSMTVTAFFFLPRMSVLWDQTLLNWLEGLAN